MGRQEMVLYLGKVAGGRGKGGNGKGGGGGDQTNRIFHIHILPLLLHFLQLRHEAVDVPVGYLVVLFRREYRRFGLCGGA